MTKRPSMHSDKHWVKSKWYPLIVGATAAFVVVFGFIFIDSTEDAAFKARERIDITEHVGHVSDAVKSVFSIHLGALNALEGLVKTRPNLTQDVFKGVAMALVQGHPAIRQIQLSPDAIVTYLHPTHAKDKARGLDLRSLPTQRVAVEQTIRDGLIKTVGPLTLAQGGRALITRKPIYTGNGQNRRFWGFATIILDYPRLLKELRASLDHHLFDVVLKVSDANGRKGEFIFGDRDRFSPNQDVMAKIDLPGTRWVLAVAPRNGWASHRPGRWLLLVVGFLVSVLCGALAYWDAARRIALKSAEQEAIEKSALHQTTLGTMAQGIAVYDADLRLISFNDRFGKILRLPPGLLHEGVSLEKIIRYRNERGDYDERDVKESIEKRIERAKFTDERTEERTLPDGMVYVYHRKPMPAGGYVFTYTDITDLRQAEQASAEKAALLDATFQNMAQGIAVYDSDLKLVAFNPQFAEITGVPADVLHLGMTREELLRYRAEIGWFGDTDVEKIVANRLESAKRGETSRSERISPDGREYLYERTPTPDGGYISTVTDTTERREAERLLQQAQKMEAVGQLTGGIAHDFNNLLAVSLGNVELAEEVAEAGGDVQPFLTTIKRATERGASLTSKLLAFSRKQTLFPQVIDAGELVGGMTGLLRSSLGETIEIKIIANDDLWPCEVDPHQLESAVLNLALNARDAMPGGGKLTIGTTNVSLDDDYAAAQAEVELGEYVMVAVTDTGTGMPQEVIDHAFDPFFTTKEVGRGSGLGLSMVYGFVKQSGGHVTIYSEEGEGTTVKLYLPRSDRAEGHLGQADDQADIPQARGETVMVVEDDPDVRTLSVALLRSLGYEILETADAKSALKALESAPRVNLLFTDVVLPGGMSGPQLAAEVQSRFPGIAVLYTSGYTELANFDEGTLGEDTELLQKPYRKADLARKVRRALDQAQV